MKLGQVAQINIGVSDMRNSLAFYEKLGFARIEVSANPYPWARITDGQNLILLNEDGNRYMGLVYFSRDAKRRIAKMEQNGIEFVQRREKDGKLMMAVFIGPGDLVVGLNTFDPEEVPRPSGSPITRCGPFGEFSTSVADYSAAAKFWNKLGFTSLFESEDPYPWGIASDEIIILGLHQNREYDDEIDFNAPSMTYFAPDMGERIESLRSDGFSFNYESFSESGQVNNATMLGPDGESIFLFAGEI